jgi:hypothetical protein
MGELCSGRQKFTAQAEPKNKMTKMTFTSITQVLLCLIQLRRALGRGAAVSRTLEDGGLVPCIFSGVPILRKKQESSIGFQLLFEAIC